MPLDPVTVRPEDVEARRTAARDAIQGAGLPEAMRVAAPGPYGLTRTALDFLEGLEGALAAGQAAEAAILARIARDRSAAFAAGTATESERRFAAAFGALIACEEALGASQRLPDAALPGRAFPADEVAPVLSANEVARAICRDLRGYVDHYRTHADSARRLGDATRLAVCARSYLKRMALAAREAAEAIEHQTLREALDAATLRLPGVDYVGLVRRDASQEDEPDLLEVGPEDVVGNAEVLAAALKLARAVAAFDLAEGRNPRTVANPVLFVLGSPGCGKTTTAHAVGRYFLDLCREARLPARFRVIRRTDWASHYQNKSASDLLRIFREEIFGFHGVAGAYWPDIDTAFAARSDPDIRTEEKANLSTLFGILDGTVGPRNGKWFLLCDANYLQMDDALASRLTEDPKMARGPETALDYVRLLRDIKLARWRNHLPGEEVWPAIGSRLVASGLSGRAVAAIAGRISAALQDIDEPEGFFTMTYEEKSRVLAEQARSITAEKIHEEIERYVRFEKDAAERAHRARFDRRVEEIHLQLRAHAAASGLA